MTSCSYTAETEVQTHVDWRDVHPPLTCFSVVVVRRNRQEKHNNNNTTSLLQQRPTNNNTNTNNTAFVFLLIPLWRLLISVLLILACFRWCCSSPLSDFLLLSVWLQVSAPDLLLIFLQVSPFLLPNILPLCFVFGNIFFLFVLQVTFVVSFMLL